MNSDSDMQLIKFNIGDRHIYVKILWMLNENDMFHVKIFEGQETWSGRYSNEFAQKYQEFADETKEEYVENARVFFSGNSDSCEFNFIQDAEDSNSGTFVWKKKFEGSSALTLHGSVPVHLDSYPESKDSLIDYLITENKGLHVIVDDLNMKADTLSDSLEKCKQEMEKFVEIKTSLEISLYGKFIQLLNSKKRRIELLEENILSTINSRDH